MSCLLVLRELGHHHSRPAQHRRCLYTTYQGEWAGGVRHPLCNQCRWHHLLDGRFAWSPSRCDPSRGNYRRNSVVHRRRTSSPHSAQGAAPHPFSEVTPNGRSRSDPRTASDPGAWRRKGCPSCAVAGAATGPSTGAACAGPQRTQNRARQPVLWVPPNAPESAISRLRPTTERRARTTGIAIQPAAQNGTSWCAPAPSPDCGRERAMSAVLRSRERRGRSYRRSVTGRIHGAQERSPRPAPGGECMTSVTHCDTVVV
jgi:hypothetical protein